MIYGFWHTFNRGVEKRDIFLDQEDFFRGVHNLYEFNDINTVLNLYRRVPSNPNPASQIVWSSTPHNAERRPRDLLVDLFAWCLRNNHYHLFSSPKDKNDLAKFHHKLGIGYTNYFNLKYKRSGVLFQGRYKKVQVMNDAQLGHLICYVHANPLEIWKPDWKKTGINDLEIQDALKFLLDKKNRWSSHQDYWGVKNFPSLINTDFLFNFFGGPEGYRKVFTDCIIFKRRISRDKRQAQRINGPWRGSSEPSPGRRNSG